MPNDEKRKPLIYDTLSDLFDARSKMISCKPLADAISGFSDDSALFFQMIDTQEGFDSFSSMLEEAVNDKSKQENAKWFLRDKCRIITLQFSTIDKILTRAESAAQPKNLEYIEARKAMIAKVKRIVFGSFTTSAPKPSEKLQTKSEPDLDVIISSILQSLTGEKVSRSESVKPFTDEELQHATETESIPFPWLTTELSDNPEIKPLFELLTSIKNRRQFKLLLSYVSMDLMNVKFVNGQMFSDPITIRQEQLRSYIEQKFNWIKEYNESIIEILEQCAKNIDSAVEIDQLARVLFFTKEAIRVLFPESKPLVDFTKSRAEDLKNYIEKRQTEFRQIGLNKLSNDVEQKTPIVTELETGSTTTLEQLVALLEKYLTNEQKQKMEGNFASELAVGLLYLSTMAVASEENIRATFDRQAINFMVEQPTEIVDQMIEVWMQLGIIGKQPDELAKSFENYYIVTPEVGQALETILDNED